MLPPKSVFCPSKLQNLATGLHAQPEDSKMELIQQFI